MDNIRDQGWFVLLVTGCALMGVDALPRQHSATPFSLSGVVFDTTTLGQIPDVSENSVVPSEPESTIGASSLCTGVQQNNIRTRGGRILRRNRTP